MRLRSTGALDAHDRLREIPRPFLGRDHRRRRRRGSRGSSPGILVGVGEHGRGEVVGHPSSAARAARRIRWSLLAHRGRRRRPGTARRVVPNSYMCHLAASRRTLHRCVPMREVVVGGVHAAPAAAPDRAPAPASSAPSTRRCPPEYQDRLGPPRPRARRPRGRASRPASRRPSPPSPRSGPCRSRGSRRVPPRSRGSGTALHRRCPERESPASAIALIEASSWRPRFVCDASCLARYFVSPMPTMQARPGHPRRSAPRLRPTPAPRLRLTRDALGGLEAWSSLARLSPRILARISSVICRRSPNFSRSLLQASPDS